MPSEHGQKANRARNDGRQIHTQKQTNLRNIQQKPIQVYTYTSYRIKYMHIAATQHHQQQKFRLIDIYIPHYRLAQ